MEIPAVPYKDLRKERDAESSEDIRRRVITARAKQDKRFAKTKIHANAQMAAATSKKHCKTDEDFAALLESAIDKLGLSARAYNRIRKISRTIADLKGVLDIESAHIADIIPSRDLYRGKRLI